MRLRPHFILVALAPASAALAQVCALPPAIAPADPSSPPALTADAASLEDDIATATGDVRLERAGQALEAPRLRFNRATQEVFAEQGLRYLREGLSLSAERAAVDIDDGTGIFEDAEFALRRSGGRGGAATIQALGDGRYLLTDADYTTCPGPDPAWQLTADRIELNRETGRGESFGTVLRVAGLPVFYTPYLNFPIDDQRHTGFLTPTLGHSSDDGLVLAAPYYINIAPDLDATVTPRLLTERGLQLAGQLRYLNRHSVGEVAAAFLPSDNEFGDDRALLHYDHRGQFTAYTAVQIDYNWVSDDDYFEDLSASLARTSKSQLERLLRLTAATSWARFALLAQDYQTLDDDDSPLFIREPYARLPAARVSLLDPDGRWRLGLDATAVNFQRDIGVEAIRYDLRPRLLWGLDKRGWYINSELAWRYTRYEVQNNPAADLPSREIPSFSVDAGLRFARVLDNGWIQTLEPRAFYLYNDYEAQSALPLFDTGVPDLHFYRLFAHNRFLGADRIGDANQITLALTSRFLEPQTGRTVLKLELGRIFGFRELDVRLPMRSPIGFGERHSDIVGNIEYQPANDWLAGATLQYDPQEGRANRAGLRAGYRDEAGRELRVGYRFFRDVRPAPGAAGGRETLEQTEVLLAWPLGERWEVIGRWNYSLAQHQSVQTLAGFEYHPSCCWAFRLAYWRHVHNDRGEYDSAVMLQVELTGLGRFGDDIESLLERDIVSSESDFYPLRYR